MKKNVKIMSGVLSIAMVVALSSCDKAESQEQSFVALDINPSVELVLDKNNKVINVYCSNEDAQVLLYNEENLIGLDVKMATEKIASLAIELGYLTEDNKVINTSVISLKGEKYEKEINSSIEAELTSTAAKNGLEIQTTITGDFSLNRKIAAIKEAYSNNEKVQSMSASQFKLIISATESGKVTLDAALSLDTEELLEIISKAHEKIELFANDTYLFAKAQAYNIYNAAMSATMDSAYSVIYAKHLDDHRDTYYYGTIYQLYQLSSSRYNAIADAAEYASKIANQSLNEQQIAVVLDILNLDDSNISLIQDSVGNVTLKSIDAYANKLFKNSELNAELEETMDELSTTLNNVEKIIEEKVNQVQDEYTEEIKAIVATCEAALAPLLALSSLLAPIKAFIEPFIDELNNLKDMIANGITIDKLREFAITMETKANEVLEKIKKDLSKEELEEVANLQATIQNSFASAKETMDKAIKQAEDAAKSYFQSLKDRRKTA